MCRPFWIKWLPWVTYWKFMMPQYQNIFGMPLAICVLQLVLLSQNTTLLWLFGGHFEINGCHLHIDMLKIHDGSISRSFWNVSGFILTKYGAFITKCTIIVVIWRPFWNKWLPWVTYWKFIMAPYPDHFWKSLASFLPNVVPSSQNT